jgi:hypothetical protein
MHIEVLEIEKSLLLNVANGNVTSVFVSDTSGDKWYISQKGMEKFKASAILMKEKFV